METKYSYIIYFDGDFYNPPDFGENEQSVLDEGGVVIRVDLSTGKAEQTEDGKEWKEVTVPY